MDVIGLDSGVQAVTAGGVHTCVLTAGGGVQCWGLNSHGQLGDGTTADRSIPVGVGGLDNGVQAIAAGEYHTCALTNSGGVKCWGANEWGQLGDGTTANHSMPVDVTGLSGRVQAIASGRFHTCASVVGGRLKCWGWDEDGQLGLGAILQRLAPVDVVENVPHLSINYSTGQPGSYFTLTGENWAPSSVVTITANDVVLTDTLHTNETGGFILFVNTAGADVGVYLVTASVNPSASIQFLMHENAPLRQQEGGGQTVSIPAGIAIPYRSVYLPLIAR